MTTSHIIYLSLFEQEVASQKKGCRNIKNRFQVYVNSCKVLHK